MPAWARPSPLTATPASEPHALEASVPEVAIQEVGVGVVGHEEIDVPIVVVVRGDHAEAVRAGGIGQTVGRRGLLETAIAQVLEEEIGLARETCGPHHDAGAVAPHERALSADDRFPRRFDVSRDVQVQIAVIVGVEERAARAPAAGRDAGSPGDLFERPVSATAEQEVRPPVRDVEVEMSVVVEITSAHAVAPGRGVHARLCRHVLELPSAQVAIERISMGDALACRAELGRGDEVDVEPAVTVVIEQRHPAAARLQDVVFRRPAAVRAHGQLHGLLEGGR